MTTIPRPETDHQYDKEQMMIDKFKPYLNDGNLIEEIVAANGKDTYLMPTRRNAGHVAVALIREITAPTVFRNAEEEITDIEDRAGIRRVRATPSKFKFGERGRGLLVLRAWNVGGRMPQNRTAVGDRMPVRDALDLNTLVFGDSAMWGTRVLPVKAAVQYSDALSTVPYRDAVGESFHHRGDETGTLWDAEGKRNTENLFTRHFVLPGHASGPDSHQQWPPASADRARSLAAQPWPRGLVWWADLNHRRQRAHAYRRYLRRSPRGMPLASPYELLAGTAAGYQNSVRRPWRAAVASRRFRDTTRPTPTPHEACADTSGSLWRRSNGTIPPCDDATKTRPRRSPTCSSSTSHQQKA